MDLSGAFTVDDVSAVPPPTWRHQWLVFRMQQYFEQIGRDAYAGIGIRFADRSFRTPDVSVLRPGAVVAPTVLQPPEILDVVVEVVTRSSADEDHLVKPEVYAGAGIPGYWRVEEDADRYLVVMSRIEGTRYVEQRSVDLDELTAQRIS